MRKDESRVAFRAHRICGARTLALPVLFVQIPERVIKDRVNAPCLCFGCSFLPTPDSFFENPTRLSTTPGARVIKRDFEHGVRLARQQSPQFAPRSLGLRIMPERLVNFVLLIER